MSKISSGRFEPIIPGRYSQGLVNICHALLSLDATRRPTPEAILSSAAAQPWLWVLPNPSPLHRWSENGGPSAAGARSAALSRSEPREL